MGPGARVFPRTTHWQERLSRVSVSERKSVLINVPIYNLLSPIFPM
jgi:hypothetical protein